MTNTRWKSVLIAIALLASALTADATEPASFFDLQSLFELSSSSAANSCDDGWEDACDVWIDSEESCDGICGTGCSHDKPCRCGKSQAQSSCLDPWLPRSNLPLPLLKGLAEDRGITLPLPLGVGFIWTEMDRNVAVSDLRLGLGNMPPTSVERVEVPTTTFHASTQLARLDLWLLPCFNLYGVVGHTRTTGNVAVTANRFPLPISPPITLNVPVELEGTTAGWGFTTGIGSKTWFATLDVNKTWTDFSRLDSSLTALVMAPRVGLVIDRPILKGEIHVGAMWQDTAQTVSLTIDSPILGNDLHVQVDQIEPRPWNFLVGGLWAIDERVHLIAEGGMGGREYIISGIMVRF